MIHQLGTINPDPRIPANLRAKALHVHVHVYLNPTVTRYITDQPNGEVNKISREVSTLTLTTSSQAMPSQAGQVACLQPCKLAGRVGLSIS